MRKFKDCQVFCLVSRTTVSTCNEIGEDHSKHNCDGITGKEVTDAAMWPLSTSEAKIVDNNLQKASEWWWLRSPGTYANCAAVVYDSGVVSSGGDGVNHGDGAARPAFNLDLSKVLFSTDSGENKSSVLVATSDRSATAWKLTQSYFTRNPPCNIHLMNLIDVKDLTRE